MIGQFTDYAQFTVMVSLQLCSVYPEFSVLQPKDAMSPRANGSS